MPINYLIDHAEELELKLVDMSEKADHWELTCHAQWETSQQSEIDCNVLNKAIHQIMGIITDTSTKLDGKEDRVSE